MFSKEAQISDNKLFQLLFPSFSPKTDVEPFVIPWMTPRKSIRLPEGVWGQHKFHSPVRLAKLYVSINMAIVTLILTILVIHELLCGFPIAQVSSVQRVWLESSGAQERCGSASSNLFPLLTSLNTGVTGFARFWGSWVIWQAQPCWCTF